MGNMRFVASFVTFWGLVVLANSLPNRTPANCAGVQVTRGQQGGIYYADAGGNRQTSYGWGSSSNNQPVVDVSSNSQTSGYGSTSNNIGSTNQYGSAAGGTWSGDNRVSNAVFARDVLSSHNSYRAKHSTPPVTLSPQMTAKAQAWAEEIASGRVSLGHSNDAVEGIYGESVQVVNYPNPSGSEVIDHWYSEMDNYNYSFPSLVRRPLSRRNSHFTAMVWYGTRQIGVGKAVAPDGKAIVVVNYYPPGNSVDTLEDNVYPPRG